MAVCRCCVRTLTFNEVGLYRKLIDRQAEEFLCKDCLAKEIPCDVRVLDEKIRQFIDQGCSLFEKEPDHEDR